MAQIVETGLLVSPPNGSKPDALALLIEKATFLPDFDVAKLKELLEMKERYDRNEARKAFVEAMNAFKKNPPVITKNKAVTFGTTSYSHATLDHVCDVITKSLGEHGISHRWKVEQGDAIRVTCVLTHEMGHSEETTLQGPADGSGSKNAIQGIGSTVTYLERYTLLAATGLAAANTDTDANVPHLDDLRERLEFIANCRNPEELQKVFATAYKEASKLGAFDDMKTLTAAKDKKRGEFRANN